MATMTSQQRADCAAESMRDTRWSGVPNVLKADWRATVDAIDQWVSDAATGIPATSYNSALPVTFRTNASAAQKALALVFVVSKRYLTGV